MNRLLSSLFLALAAAGLAEAQERTPPPGAKPIKPGQTLVLSGKRFTAPPGATHVVTNPEFLSLDDDAAVPPGAKAIGATTTRVEGVTVPLTATHYRLTATFWPQGGRDGMTQRVDRLIQGSARKRAKGKPPEKMICDDDGVCRPVEPGEKVICDDDGVCRPVEPGEKVICDDDGVCRPVEPGEKVICDDDGVCRPVEPDEKVICDDDGVCRPVEPGEKVICDDDGVCRPVEPGEKVICDDDGVCRPVKPGEEVVCDDEGVCKPVKFNDAPLGAEPETKTGTHAFPEVEAAMKRASKSGKQVLVLYTWTLCKPCKALKARMEDDARLKHSLSGYEVVTLWLSSKTRLKFRREGVRSFPTIHLFTPQGDALSKFAAAQKMHDRLPGILDGFAR